MSKQQSILTMVHPTSLKPTRVSLKSQKASKDQMLEIPIKISSEVDLSAEKISKIEKYVEVTKPTLINNILAQKRRSTGNLLV